MLDYTGLVFLAGTCTYLAAGSRRLDCKLLYLGKWFSTVHVARVLVIPSVIIVWIHALLWVILGWIVVSCIVLYIRVSLTVTLIIVLIPSVWSLGIILIIPIIIVLRITVALIHIILRWGWRLLWTKSQYPYAFNIFLKAKNSSSLLTNPSLF